MCSLQGPQVATALAEDTSTVSHTESEARSSDSDHWDPKQESLPPQPLLCAQKGAGTSHWAFYAILRVPW